MNRSNNAVYTAEVHSTGGREGAARSSDGRLDIKLSPPGAAREGTNPEQLFAAGWSACFMGAMGLAAYKLKVKLPAGTAIDTEVDLCKDGDDYTIQARMKIGLPGLDRGTAQALTEEAHRICPYSKATRGNIGFAIDLV